METIGPLMVRSASVRDGSRMGVGSAIDDQFAAEASMLRGDATLRRAMIVSTLLESLVPHSQRGASALPKVLPKAVREYSTFGGISPKSTRSMIPSACNSLSC